MHVVVVSVRSGYASFPGQLLRGLGMRLGPGMPCKYTDGS